MGPKPQSSPTLRATGLPGFKRCQEVEETKDEAMARPEEVRAEEAERHRRAGDLPLGTGARSVSFTGFLQKGTIGLLHSEF